MRIAAAVKWYEMGIVSQEKAAEIAGLCREDWHAFSLFSIHKWLISELETAQHPTLSIWMVTI